MTINDCHKMKCQPWSVLFLYCLYHDCVLESVFCHYCLKIGLNHVLSLLCKVKLKIKVDVLHYLLARVCFFSFAYLSQVKGYVISETVLVVGNNCICEVHMHNKSCAFVDDHWHDGFLLNLMNHCKVITKRPVATSCYRKLMGTGQNPMWCVHTFQQILVQEV